MHYYNHNIGDYRRDTGWLCLLQHGIYRQLLDNYYLSEEPLSLDIKKLSLIICARSKREVDALKQVLDFFFDKSDGGYVHKRCEEEINIFHSKKEKKRTAANTRWGKREVSENKGIATDSNNSNAMHMHSACNALGMLTNNQEPITNNQEPIIKEKETKETVQPEGFTEFWKIYPNAVAKKKCLDIWKRKKLDSIAETILDDVRRKSKDEAWTKEGGRFVPMSSTYLTQERWTDKPKQEAQKRERAFVV